MMYAYSIFSDIFRREIEINIVNKLLNLCMVACCLCVRRECKPALRWISTVA